MLKSLENDLKKSASTERAKNSLRFFKTAPGEYGHGDKFLGLTTPEQRQIAKKYISLSFSDLQSLLNSAWHEYRLVALVILMEQYKKGSEEKKKRIFNFYLKNKGRINNWDLVDITCPHIVGAYLLDKIKEREVLLGLAKSSHLWSKRIAIISTFAFIRKNDFNYSLKIIEILLTDKHDLIHKAIGWTLREIGKRNIQVEREYIDKNISRLPRTALRYAIERFPEELRQTYLRKKI